MTRRTNARILGPAASASSTVASGVWSMSEQLKNKQSGNWPGALKTVQIKVWGAGGGRGDYNSVGTGTDGENGGPGGYATATFTIVPGTTLSIFVGQGGSYNDNGGAPNGGRGNNGAGGGGTISSGKGGGFCGVFTGSQTWASLTGATIPTSAALIVAGSGGGGSYYINGQGGGYGGGDTGGAGMNRVSSSSGTSGSGGTASAGGAAGGAGGSAGSLYKGGGVSSSSTVGGGGGAGWYGGGGANNDGSGGGGGGGSGMIASITSGTSLPSGVSAVSGNSFSTQTGTGKTAPNNADSDYVSGRGEGGTSSPNADGGDGLIIIYANGVKTSYNYTGNVQTLVV